MYIVVTLIVGLVVGGLAKLMMPGKDPGGFAITMMLGVVGAVVAGMLGHSFGWYEAGEDPGIVASVIGSIGLLAVYRAVAGRRSW